MFSCLLLLTISEADVAQRIPLIFEVTGISPSHSQGSLVQFLERVEFRNHCCQVDTPTAAVLETSWRRDSVGKKTPEISKEFEGSGVGDGSRTRDIRIHNPALYP
jgi:hypothetical protein